MRDIPARLQDILEAIERIQSEQPSTKSDFLSNRLLQVWMVHHLMIIGEAVRSIDPAFKQKHPSVQWREIAGMRNILVHDYFRINDEIVWETIQRDVPILKNEIEQLLARLPRPEDGAA